MRRGLLKQSQQLYRLSITQEKRNGSNSSLISSYSTQIYSNLEICFVFFFCFVLFYYYSIYFEVWINLFVLYIFLCENLPFQCKIWVLRPTDDGMYLTFMRRLQWLRKELSFVLNQLVSLYSSSTSSSTSSYCLTNNVLSFKIFKTKIARLSHLDF